MSSIIYLKSILIAPNLALMKNMYYLLLSLSFTDNSQLDAQIPTQISYSEGK